MICTVRDLQLDVMQTNAFRTKILWVKSYQAVVLVFGRHVVKRSWMPVLLAEDLYRNLDGNDSLTFRIRSLS